jgi:hypothetical protein
VLEAMLNSPDTHVGEVDNKMRTAMHGEEEEETKERKQPRGSITGTHRQK